MPGDLPPQLLERRVLILAPTGRDAPLTRELLAEHGIRCFICADMAQLVNELGQGAGALLISEEALPQQGQLYALGDRLGRQPPGPTSRCFCSRIPARTRNRCARRCARWETSP